MAEVLLEKVSKVYPGGVRAVDAIDLRIADGEFTVLVGPSGCGKSTTLRMIAGLEEATGGRISIGGRVVNDTPAKDRDIAMVFQSYALYPHLTVRQNLEFPLLRRRTHASALKSLASPAYAARRRAERQAIDARVATAARTLGIETLLGRTPRELSGGQRQRVALGRALVRDPAVFLLDEPLSNLDARLRIEMRAELRTLHRRAGRTMVHVTHDQEEAMTLGDRLVVMKDGVIRQAGSPIEIYERPADAFVAAFIGTPAMNLIEGDLRSEPGEARFDGPGGLRLHGAFGEAALQGTPHGAARRAILGLRPDAVQPAAAAPSATAAGDRSACRLAATLVAIERYGDRADLVCAVGDQRLVSRVANADGLVEGAPIALRVDLAKAHLFEASGAQRRLA
jgi:multiple sugar transport system ATP-binding protein